MGGTTLTAENTKNQSRTGQGKDMCLCHGRLSCLRTEVFCSPTGLAGYLFVHPKNTSVQV